MQWEFVKREISRWLEPMVSGELTAASAHRSKVHPTTNFTTTAASATSTSTTNASRAREIALPLSTSLGRLRSFSPVYPSLSLSSSVYLSLSVPHRHETYSPLFSLSLSISLSLLFASFAPIYLRFLSALLDRPTERPYHTRMAHPHELVSRPRRSCSHAGTSDVWKPGHACTHIPFSRGV